MGGLQSARFSALQAAFRLVLVSMLALFLVPLGATQQAHADQSSLGADIQAYVQQVQEAYNSALANGSQPAYALTTFAQESYNANAAEDAGISTLANDEYPDQYYLTNEGTATTVKLQNPWGTCWAFSALAGVESSVLKRTGATGAADAATVPQVSGLVKSPDLSEHALAWFLTTPQTQESAGSQAGEGLVLNGERVGANQFCPGGSPEAAVNVLTAWQAGATEAAVPYTYLNDDGTFHTQTMDWALFESMNKDWSLEEAMRLDESSGVRVTDTTILPSPAVVEGGTWMEYDPDATLAIKQALMDTSAVSILIAADQSLPGDASSGDYFSYDNWCQYNNMNEPTVDHGVTIVGWDNSYPSTNFSGTKGGEPPAGGAWLVKNSWGSAEFCEDYGLPGTGSTWGIPDSKGHSGFYWISYYDHTIQNPVAWSTTSTEESYDNNYQYDYVGVSYAGVAISLPVEAKTANVFTADSPEILKAVSAKTFEQNQEVNVEIYLLDDEDVYPTDGALVFQQTETFSYAGFHTIELDADIILDEGQRYAVVEYIPTTINGVGGGYLSLEWATSQEVFGSTAQVVTNEGETYCSEDGGCSWKTPQELEDDASLSDLYLGSALIKAYTDEDPNPESRLELKSSSQPGPLQAKTYDAQPLAQADIVAEASYGAQPADPSDLSYTYTPTTQLATRAAGQGADGMPIDAGTYDVVVTLASKVVDGRTYQPATASTTVTIAPAAFSYAVADQNVVAGSRLNAVQAPALAQGVQGETVAGTLAWFANDARSQALERDYVLPGQVGSVVPLSWTFTPASTETNYVTTPVMGRANITLVDEAHKPSGTLASTGDMMGLPLLVGAVVALGAVVVLLVAFMRRKQE